ncbi:MAG TPA: maleylacetoacetate isomerase [Arenimonas sp.]|nr:maleylacetoacetate isomerase [Arenimonas sp.]
MSAGELKLFSYWRSSAAYRVRIALNLKGLAYETVPVHLLKDGGEQHRPEFAEINPQELVPVLEHGHRTLRQSLAIIEYLDETWPTNPLMPATARDRQRVRALAQLVACDIHPLNNLRVMQFLEREFSMPQAERDLWTRHWLQVGLQALEASLFDNPGTGSFCEGESPTMADCCLVPQVYNARRFEIDLEPFPTIRRIEAECLALDAFDLARPEKQPDAPAH